MRSTSATPPAPQSSTTQPSPMNQDDDDDSSDFIVVSENIRTPTNKPGSPSSKPPRATATPSPSTKRRASAIPAKPKSSSALQQANTKADDTNSQSEKKQGKKRARKEEDEEHKDERLVSEELKLGMANDEDEKKDATPKKRGYRIFTVEEDRLIVEQMLNNFDASPVRLATGRCSTVVVNRSRLIIRAALRALHGEQQATLPGEASGSSSGPSSPTKR
ncbi:uncharacterized protein SRS1_12665 [Sporisorium reilianum f. sp. reilianum]|uniref:Uncharacterized protein n=1 Tax=Sporisorium reilianum f. sp. reilianum TaxID=72559 RepID=A0A2N8UA60_9BASI|nr:uncharacterized protein SRS1_12665 [Sporisorium reilianum f. sp. reilianum]